MADQGSLVGFTSERYFYGSRELEQRGNSVLKDGISSYTKLINGAKLISWIYERYCVYDRTM